MDPINTPNPSAQPVAQPVQSDMSPEHKKVGPIITILVVALVLIIGALYIFASRIDQPLDSDTLTAQEAGSASVPVDVKPITSTSDDINTLETDLNAATDGIETQNF